MKKELNLTGTINQNGKLNMYSQHEFFNWLEQHRGKRVQMTFRVYEPGTSVALRGYYANKVLPDIREAFKEQGSAMTLKETEEYCRQLSPVCWHEILNPETGNWEYWLREIIDLDRGIKDQEELSNGELVEHLEFLKKWAAENLGVFIDDPQTLIK